MILSLFKRNASRKSVRAVYAAIVAAARHPRLYAEWGVADTVDGRFDMIILHAMLVIDRLAADRKEARNFAQRLADEVFADMDRSLREMGVGDLTVGKKVRRMAEVFYGRVGAYMPALKSGDAQALAAAIYRNVHEGTGDEEGSRWLAAHALHLHHHLHGRPVGPILGGKLDFPDP